MKKLIYLLILLAVIFGGLWFFGKEVKEPTAFPSPVTVPTATSTLWRGFAPWTPGSVPLEINYSTSFDRTTGLQVYKNETLGFEFSYPVGMVLVRQKQPAVNGFFESLAIGVAPLDFDRNYYKNVRLSVDVWGDQGPQSLADLTRDPEPPAMNVKTEKKVIDNLTTIIRYDYLFVGDGPATPVTDYRIVRLGGKYGNLVINISGDQAGKVVSSFKFTKSDLAFLSPAAGEVWQIGGSYTIKLNKSLLAGGVDNPWHRMFLVGQDGKQVGIIACVKGDPTQTEWQWKISTLIGFCGAGDHKPIEVQPGIYKLQLLHDTLEQEVTAESDYFTIK